METIISFILFIFVLAICIIILTNIIKTGEKNKSNEINEQKLKLYNDIKDIVYIDEFDIVIPEASIIINPSGYKNTSLMSVKLDNFLHYDFKYFHLYYSNASNTEFELFDIETKKEKFNKNLCEKEITQIVNIIYDENEFHKFFNISKTKKKAFK